MKREEVEGMLLNDAELAVLNAPQSVQDLVQSIQSNVAQIQNASDRFQQLVDEMHGQEDDAKLEPDHMSEHVQDKNGTVSRLGQMMGKIGTVWTRGYYTIDDAAAPITRRILYVAKDLIDATTKAAERSAEAAWTSQTKAYANLLRYREDSKNLLSQHATSAAAKMRSFAHERFGDMFSKDKDTLDAIDGAIDGMIQNAATFVDGIDRIEVHPPSSDIRDRLLQQGNNARQNMLDDALEYAAWLVGPELAREIAIEVFGLQSAAEIDESFGRMPRKRGVVSGLMGTVSSVMKAGGQVGMDAINTARGMVKDLAYGKDGTSGLAGVASSMLGTAGGVASAIGTAASNVVGSIFGNSSETKGGVMEAAKGVANSIIGGAAGVGQALTKGIGAVAKGAVSAVGDVAKGLADFAGSALSTAGDLASGLFGSLKDMLGLSEDEAEQTVEDAKQDQQEMAEEEQSDVEESLEEMDEGVDNLDDAAEDLGDEYDEEYWDLDWDEYEDEDVPEEPEEGDEDPFADEAEQEQEQEQQEAEQAEEENATQNSQETTTPMGNDDPVASGGLQLTEDITPTLGWRGVKAEFVNGLQGLMHDGDQILFNPYGSPYPKWTMFSFRPSDAAESWPQIAITPASFLAIRSMDKMLDNIPFVVVKEYFFKNVASTMIDFIAKISAQVKEAFKSAGQADAKGDTTVQEQSSQGTADAKNFGQKLTEKIKGIFGAIDIKKQVIDIPYVLYAGLRQRQYGNTYIFPYIADSGTVINEASNDPEWNEKGSGLMQMLKDAMNEAAQFLGNAAASMAGSDAKAATLFPAPTWNGPNGGNHQSFSFDLILINDNIVKSRNNYMCVNTIIHNNRSIQKAILAFPGALYEVWLPTGQRHLMCTGDFKLYPLGLNRKTPKDFFNGGGSGFPGASHRIGTTPGNIAKLQNPVDRGHRDDIEVLPDAYKLSITFRSCLANNMNTAVFQYYVEMSGYSATGATNDPEKAPAGTTKAGPGQLEEGSALTNSVMELLPPSSIQTNPQQKNGAKSVLRDPNATMRDLMESTEWQEKFEEATYNKQLGRLDASQGDQTMNSDGVLATVRKAQATIDDASEFLSRLYNAPKSSLWYMPDPDDRLYTTLKPDYAKMLRDKYQEKMGELRKVDSQLKSTERKMTFVDKGLNDEFDMGKRAELLARKLSLVKSANSLQERRSAVADELIQLDTDIIQSAFDEQDEVVAVRKTDVTIHVFKQAWNERILNPYEREKLQYLTSTEKEHYFKDKVRQLQKVDTHEMLNHADWFFRVVVAEYIVREMHRLVVWFKNCRWDEFENIYKITRKLRMLQLDMDAVWADAKFDINHTNLFQISDGDAKDFTKIDEMLSGNTLYELFKAQMSSSWAKVLDSGEEPQDTEPKEDKEVLRDRESELEFSRRRVVRDDVVCRVWGSEAELTKTAYKKVNDENPSIDPPVTIAGNTYTNIGDLKNRIIELKLENSTSQELQDLLGALVTQVRFVKEQLVSTEMGQMHALANEEIGKKDDSANAEVVR